VMCHFKRLPRDRDENGVTAWNRNPLNWLVGGEGFEPSTSTV
jgi:hypothetical protein